MQELGTDGMEEESMVPKLLCEETVEFFISVEIIQNQGMTKARKVFADLMMTTCFDFCFDVCCMRECTHNSVACECRDFLSTHPCREGFFDFSFLLIEALKKDRMVELLPTFESSLYHSLVRFFRPSKDDDAGGLKIQAMESAESRILLLQKIEERELLCFSAPLYHELTAQFVHGEEILVLIEDSVSGDWHELRIAE